MPSPSRDRVLDLLVTCSYRHKPEGFTLASGKVSTEYIDCRMTLSHGESFPHVGQLFLAAIDPRAIAVGGLTLGADPIAYQASNASALAGGRPLRWFSVRKQPKKHGLRKLVEGDVPSGAPVVVVDDVVTTGGSTREAIQKCREEGLDVVQVLVLVDREEEGGMESIRAEAGAGVAVSAMFTKTEVRKAWEARQERGRSEGG